jgi:hypothetical protein
VGFDSPGASITYNKENIMSTTVKITKCIDVVYMDEKIEGSKILHFLGDVYPEHGNGTYIQYIVGGYWQDEDEGDDDYLNSKFKQVDKILMENYGLQDDEEILLLVWW